MTITQTQITKIYIGKISKLANSFSQSAIRKNSVSGYVNVKINGIEGDYVADFINHGGEDKAIHHFPYKHYPIFAQTFSVFDYQWQLQIKNCEVCLMGENFSDQRLDEDKVCIGDIWSSQNVILQISQPRQPCWKIDTIFELDNKNGLMKYIINKGYVGWYYRVLQPGEMNAGSKLRLIERPNPQLTIRKVWFARIGKVSTLKPNLYQQLADCPQLSTDWRNSFEKKLATI